MAGIAVTRTALRAASGLVMGTAAWFSLGVFALTPHSSNSHAVGLLPPLWLWIALAVLGASVRVRSRRLSATIALLPALSILPWLGLHAAPVLLWSGALILLPWMLVALHAVRARWNPSRADVVAAVAATALTVFTLAGSGTVVTGDEPHYLLVARSLQRDGDVDLANDYEVSRHQDFYAGPLNPRHTILTGFGREYSFHGLGVPLLVLPGFIAGGVAGARALLIMISVFGVAATWKTARALTNNNSAASVAAAFLLCQLPFLAQGAAIYPDGPAAAITAGALLLLTYAERSAAIAERWLYLCGAALSMLPWLHIRLTWLAAVFGVALLVALRKRGEPAASYVALLAAPCIAAALFFASTYVMFETLDPTAPFRQKATGSIADVPRGVFGLLADVEYGLLPYAPAAVFAAAGVRRLAGTAPLVAFAGGTASIGTLLIAATFVWWGGTSSPARFLVPVLPVCAVAVALWWTRATPLTRAVSVAFIAVGAFVAGAAAFADDGAYVTTDPDGRFTIYERLNQLVLVSDALPSLFREGAATATQFLIACSWAATGVGGFWLLRRIHIGAEATLSAAVACGLILWITLASALGWTLGGISPVTADRSQLALLRASSTSWLATAWRDGHPIGSRDAILSALSFASPAGRDPRTLLYVPSPPPGRYAIEVDRPGSAFSEGATLAIVVGRGNWPIAAWSPTSGAEPDAITLVMPVHSIQVHVDRPVHSRDLQVRLRMLGVTPGVVRGPVAEQVIRSDDTLIYLLDSAAIEGGGFWINGSRSLRIVLASPAGIPEQTMLRLEAAEKVSVTLSRDEWQHQFSTNPNQVTAVTVPASAAPEIIEMRVQGGDRRRPVLFVSAGSAPSGR
jgi:hypothetical protein